MLFLFCTQIHIINIKCTLLVFKSDSKRQYFSKNCIMINILILDLSFMSYNSLQFRLEQWGRVII